MSSAIATWVAGSKDAASLRAFLRTHTFPLVEGRNVTFVWVGRADEVRLRHWIYGLASSQPLERVEGTDLWYLTMQLPPASRVEYKFEVHIGGKAAWVRDPLNRHLARDPFGANSVAHAEGYEVPPWIQHDEGAARGSFDAVEVESGPFGRREVKVYLPARFRRSRSYPLAIVHDGEDYLRYAALGPILDNLMWRREIPDMIVAFTSTQHRLVEYANDERHARFLTEELVPRVETLFPVRRQPQSRCLIGASFGAVASFSTACRYPGFYGRLLLQSGSFAFTDIGDESPRGPVFEPVVQFMNGYRAQPTAISERVFMSCGIYESLIYENRSLVPLLEGTGMAVRFREARDGHNWENWRDRLREGLSWLFPGPFLMVYD